MRTASRRAGWAVGAPLATFRFLARTIPLNEREWHVDDGFPEATEGQVGELHGRPVRRLLRARVEGALITAEQLMDVIAAAPNVVMPFEVARFTRTNATVRALEAGDELVIRMAGPWDGPVTVTDRTPHRIRFASRHGHAQAGAFEFRVLPSEGALVLEVESLARSASRWFDLLFRLRLADRMQLHTWAHVIETAAKVAGGRVVDGIDVYSGEHRPGSRRIAVLYDAECIPCRLATALAIRLEYRHELSPVAVQSEEGTAMLAAAGSGEPPRHLWVDPRVERPVAARVLAAILRRLPRRVPAPQPPRYLAERADSVIAARRAAIDGLEAMVERRAGGP